MSSEQVPDDDRQSAGFLAAFDDEGVLQTVRELHDDSEWHALPDCEACDGTGKADPRRAKRTLVDLPEPDGHDNGGPVWSMPGGASPVTLAVVDGEAFVSALGPADPVDFAETYALAVLAAVREVRRMVAAARESRRLASGPN